MIKTTQDDYEEEKKGESEDESWRRSYPSILGSEEDDEEETKPFESEQADENMQANNTNGFEVLSKIDPEDEFLKSEHSYSLIDKLSSS